MPVLRINIREIGRWQHHLQKQDPIHHHIKNLIDPQWHHQSVIKSMSILILHLKLTEEKEVVRRDHWPLPRAIREVNRRRAPSRVRGPPHRGRSADGLVLLSPGLVPDHLAALLGARSLSPGDELSKNLLPIADHVLKAVPGAARSVKVARGLEIDLVRKEGENLKVTQNRDLNLVVVVVRRVKMNVVVNSL